MSEVLDPENLKWALAQVKRNKGAAGIDGMTVDELGAHLKANWPTIRAQLVEGSYCLGLFDTCPRTAKALHIAPD